MTIRKAMFLGILSTLLAIFIATGCSSLLTGTKVISFMVGGDDINTADELSYFQVNLTDDDVWKDHKDDIKNIDNVGFILWFDTTSDDVTGEFYIAPFDSIGYLTSAEVAAKATKILENIELPAGVATYVDWSGSLGHIVNVSILKNYAEEGKFTIYGITTTLPFEMEIDSAMVVVTVTVGT